MSSNSYAFAYNTYDLSHIPMRMLKSYAHCYRLGAHDMIALTARDVIHDVDHVRSLTAPHPNAKALLLFICAHKLYVYCMHICV